MSLPTIAEVVDDLPARSRAGPGLDLSPFFAALARHPGQWCRLELNGRKPGPFCQQLKQKGIEAAVRQGQAYARTGGDS